MWKSPLVIVILACMCAPFMYPIPGPLRWAPDFKPQIHPRGPPYLGPRRVVKGPERLQLFSGRLVVECPTYVHITPVAYIMSRRAKRTNAVISRGKKLSLRLIRSHRCSLLASLRNMFNCQSLCCPTPCYMQAR